MVSVVVAVFNGAGFVEGCLKSILAQTYKNIELIVIDDGSTDDTPAICQKVMGLDARVHVIRQENGGVSQARNRGILAATGRYITFVDADDLLPENAIRVMVDKMEQGTDLVVGSHEEFRGRTRVPHIKTPCVVTDREFAENALRAEKYLHAAWGKLFKLEIIRKENIQFIEKLPMLEDTLFTWSYYRHAHRMDVISDVIYRYRLGGTASTVKYYPARNAYLRKALDVYFAYFGGEEHAPREFVRVKITDGLMDCFRHYVSHCFKGEAAEKVSQTLEMFETYLHPDVIDVTRCGQPMADAMMQNDPGRIVFLLRRKLMPRILVKRIKKLSFRLLRFRI